MSSLLTQYQRRNLFFVTLILLLAAVLRIVHLTQQSLWTDEGFTYNVIVRADMFPEIALDTHPPFYYLLLRIWVAAAGDSVLAMRFFSVIPSLLSVALIVPLTRALTRRRRLVGLQAVPLLAALGLALADSENFLAQEMRMYTLTTMLAILSMVAYVRWLRKPRARWSALWVISTVALAHTYYLGLYIPFIQGLYALIFLRGRTRLTAVGLLTLSGILFLPWFIGVTYDQIATPPPHEMFNSQPSNAETLLELRDKYLTGQWALVGVLLGLGMMRLVYTASERVRVRWRPLREPLLVLMWVVLPAVITFVANAWLPILTPRKLALIAPAIAILMAWGLGNLKASARVLLTAVLLVYGVSSVDFYQLKEPWDHVAEDMTRYADVGDVALMEVGLGGYPLSYYLDHSTAFNRWLPDTLLGRNLPRWREDDPAAYDAELGTLLAESDTVWLAYWSPETRIFEQLAASAFVQTAVQSTDHLGNNLLVYRFDRVPEAEIARFESGMTLLSVEFQRQDGRLDLLWRSGEILPDDYSVSAFVLDADGVLVTQYDAFPFENQRPTTTWLPDEVVYDPHPLDISTLPAGRYTLGVKVYTYLDNAVYETSDGQPYAVVGEFVLP